MQARNKALLLALGLSALLLLSAVPAAEASRSGRTLTQWSDWGSTWSGWGWGGWGWARPDPSPIGSGCYDSTTGLRFRHGESQYCSGGGRRRCNWGEWEQMSGGGCDTWTRK